MKDIGTSSLWEVKYAPQCFEDYICPSNLRTFMEEVIKTKEVPTLLFHGTAGTGKTTVAKVIANELEMDMLYINGAIDGIDVIRDRVTQFCMTSSIMGGKKLVIMDELERMMAAQEALKVLIEQTEANARFVLCTNNINKIIAPLMDSRCRVFSFGQEKSKELLIQYFKRICFILENENIEYDKKVMTELTKKCFPDMRKLIVSTQTFVQMYGKIDERILLSINNKSNFDDLILAMKEKSFPKLRKLAEVVDESIYRTLYDELLPCIECECIPDVISVIGEYNKTHTAVVDKGIQFINCFGDIMKVVKWK